MVVDDLSPLPAQRQLVTVHGTAWREAGKKQ